MGYSAAEIEQGAELLAELAPEARRRAGSNYLMDNRWFPPGAYVHDEAAALDEAQIRALIVMPAGKGWIVDILLEGCDSEAVFPSLPAFVRTEDEARDKGFICLCALYQTIFARRVAQKGDGGLPSRPFDLMGHEIRITGAMQTRAELLMDYFGGSDGGRTDEKLTAAAERFIEDGRFSPTLWREARASDRSLVYFYAAMVLREGSPGLPAPVTAG